MSAAATRRMRASVTEYARRCEYWAGKAQVESDAGNEGAAICLRHVARLRSNDAFAAVAAHAAETAKAGTK